MAKGFHSAKDGNHELRLEGKLDLYHARKAEAQLSEALKDRSVRAIDVSGLLKLDTVGALLLRRLAETFEIEISHLKPEHAALFNLVAETELAPPPALRRKPYWKNALMVLGKKTVQAWQHSVELTAFFGQICVTFVKILRAPKRLRVADIMHHIEETGIHAMPIISMMAFMISIVIAYQAVAQLKPLGADHLTVNLVAISVLREMGVLLTAIMVAGRSGSAFAAEIGVMKVREEVDALRVIGIDPFEVLVMPRLIALLITLPLLTFLADAMGLLGGGVMSLLLINIPLEAFMERVRMVATGNDLMVGLIKAPVFAFLIAMVGCMHGMKVSGSAESVGIETTASVVKAIFLVLGADAIFSVVFEKMGI